jgi:sialic acid synthase SpsE
MVYVIAEVGVNHNGDCELAHKFVEAAKQAGANAVKFQLFEPDKVATEYAPLADYQAVDSSDSNQNLLLRDLEIRHDCIRSLIQRCNYFGIDFLCTPFDLSSFYFLTDEMKQPTIKVSSGDISNFPFLFKVGQRRVQLLLSTGASDIDDIRVALGFYFSGYLNLPAPTDLQTAIRIFDSHHLEDPFSRVVLFHCVSQYPAPADSLNLLAINTLKRSFPNQRIGFSDHSIGPMASLLALALGVEFLEKHITFDTSAKGPDHSSSMSIHDFQQLIDSLRLANLALGGDTKQMTYAEKEVRPKVRRGIYFSRDISAGETIQEDDLVPLRPETQTDTMIFFSAIGKVLRVNVSRHQALEENMVTD